MAECILSYDYELDQEILEAIEVTGEVQVKALIPGDSPKVQVKLALPEDFDNFSLNPLCVRP